MDASPDSRLLVLGAGVIGRVLASRLHRAGVDVGLLARGATLEHLRANGVRTREVNGSGEPVVAPVPILAADDVESCDVLLIVVRASQLDGALEVVRRLRPATVISLMHLAGRDADLRTAVTEGGGELVRAFPGLGGYLENHGTDEETVVWLDVGRTQPVTVDAAAPGGERVAELLRRTGLTVATTDDMDGWLAAHAVFVGVLGAGVARAGGDPEALAADGSLLRATCDAIRDGLRALHEQGITVQPSSIDWLHRRLPAWAGPLYWRRALRGPLGSVSIAPHIRSSGEDEMPLILSEALTVTGRIAGPLVELLGPLIAEET